MNALPERISPRLLLFFLALHVINQIDRQLVAGFAGEIMADPALSRGQFALIAGLAFSSVYTVTAVASGILVDRLGRVEFGALGGQRDDADVAGDFELAGGVPSGLIHQHDRESAMRDDKRYLG